MGTEKLVTIAKSIVSAASKKTVSKAAHKSVGRIASAVSDEFVASGAKAAKNVAGKTVKKAAKSVEKADLYDLGSKKLLPGAKKHALFTKSGELADEGVALVHMTNFSPKTGFILSDRAAYGGTRSSVHTAVNHAVEAVNGGTSSWNDCKLAVILPFDKTLLANPKGTFLAGHTADLFTKGSIRLPKGTVIVRQSKRVPKGKLRVRRAEDIEKFKQLRGVKIFETSELPHSQVGTILEKMGYTSVRGANPMYGGFGGKGKKLTKELKAWKKFADKHGIIPALHSETPNFSAELMLDMLQIENIGGISLDIVRKGQKFSFRKMLLDNISGIKAHSQKTGIAVSYDIDKLEKIIKEAKTFSDISKGIKKDIKLKSLFKHHPKAKATINYSAMPFSEQMLYSNLTQIGLTPNFAEKFHYQLNNPTTSTFSAMNKLFGEKSSAQFDILTSPPAALKEKVFYAALKNQRLIGETLKADPAFANMCSKIIYK